MKYIIHIMSIDNDEDKGDKGEILMKQMSMTHEIFEILKEMGVGNTVSTTAIKKKAPWINEGAISGSLNYFCKEGRLEKIGIDTNSTAGRKPILYRVTNGIHEDRRFHSKPKEYTRSRRSKSEDEKEKASVKETVENAVHKESSDSLVDQMMNYLSEMNDYIHKLEERNKTLKKHNEKKDEPVDIQTILRTVSEDTLFNEIVRRRQEQKVLGYKPEDKAEKMNA